MEGVPDAASGLVDVLTGVVGVIGVISVAGVVEEFPTAAPMSVPMGAKGFGRPSVPSGTKSIVESRSEAKASSLKIASSRRIFLTLSKTPNNSRAIAESSSFKRRSVQYHAH